MTASILNGRSMDDYPLKLANQMRAHRLRRQFA